MKVSIVIPIYNKEAYVRHCLTQALSQTYDDYVITLKQKGL